MIPVDPNGMSDILYEIPGNAIPPLARAGYLKARDGRSIRYACFGATGRPVRGTVLLMSGRNETIEKYFETIADLQRAGFGVAILDWRGQGRSDRLLRDPQRGHVRSFHDYTDDVDQFFSEVVLPDCRGPFHVLAHSTGALVALLAAPSMVNRVGRMVLCAPFLEVKGFPLSMRATRRVATALGWCGLGSAYVSGGPRRNVPFPLNNVTTDIVRYSRNLLLGDTHPELGMGGPTVAWIRAAAEAVERVRAPGFVARIQIPVLFIAAGADEVVSTRAIEDYALRLRSGALLTIDGARHEILQEADRYREQFLAAFLGFMPQD